MSDLQTHLDAIFEADRALRAAEARLLGQKDQSAAAKLLSAAVTEARALADRHDAVIRLQRLADLCAQVPGPEMADALLMILDDDEPSVRLHAAEALTDVGYERYAEVARAVERCLEQKQAGPAMAELPWVLAEIAEPSAAGLIGRFLPHQSGEVVASAVEALASLGDPAAVKLLEPLRNDEREVVLEDMETETVAVLGDVVEEAIDALEADDT